MHVLGLLSQAMFSEHIHPERSFTKEQHYLEVEVFNTAWRQKWSDLEGKDNIMLHIGRLY